MSESRKVFESNISQEAEKKLLTQIEMINALSNPMMGTKEIEELTKELSTLMHGLLKWDFNIAFEILGLIKHDNVKKALIDSRSSNGWTLLHTAVSYGSRYQDPTLLIRALFSLEPKPDPNIKIKNERDQLHSGATPLDLVLILGRLQAPQIYAITEVLLAHGATFSCDLKGDLKDKSIALMNYAAQKENRMFSLKESEAVLSALDNHEKAVHKKPVKSHSSAALTPSTPDVGVNITPPQAEKKSRKKLNLALFKLKSTLNVKTKLGNAWSRLFQPRSYKMDKLCDQTKRDVDYLEDIAHYTNIQLSPEAKKLIARIQKNVAVLDEYNRGNKVPTGVKDKISRIQEEMQQSVLLNPQLQNTPHPK